MNKIKPLGKYANSFQAFLVLIVIYINTVPIFVQFIPVNFVWLVSMVLWFVFVFLNRPNFFLKLPTPLVAMSLFSIYTIVIPYLFGNPIITNRYIGLAQIPFFYFAFIFNESSGNMRTNYSIIKWSILPIVFIAITTLLILIKNPYASRQATSLRSEFSSDYIFTGGYDFIYSLAIFTVILFAIYFLHSRYSNSKFQKIQLFILLVLFLITVFLSNFLTAVLMILFSISFFYVIKNNLFSLMFIIPILIILIIIFNQELISLLIDMFDLISPQGKIVDKLIDLQMKSSVFGNQNIMSDRNETYLSSFNGFLENPIFGKVIYPFSVEDNFFSGFGQHSQIIDTMSLFGIFGIIQIYFLLKIFTIRLKKGFRSLNAFTLSVMLSVLILNFFNNSTALCGFAYFFVYPSVYHLFNNKMALNIK
ncbi:MAG: hypothetical protein LLF81_05435 [Porphyromonadaceae bacterium]|nr:hypothetical protein [Porphyromonadaceae bacterium]